MTDDLENFNPPWDRIRLIPFLMASGFTSILFYFSNTGERWVPILDSANLMFHEAGHPLFGILSSRLMIYGGTLGQLTFPIVTIIYFARARKSIAFYLCIIWFCQNLWNIARYMADAREQALPLIGGGEHDWAEILSRWNALANDTKLAGKLSFLAWVGSGFAWLWLYKKFREQNKLPRTSVEEV